MNLIDKLKLAGNKIKSAKKILLIGHIHPDADAIASLGAMIEVLQTEGLDFYAYAANKTGQGYEFIPNESLINNDQPIWSDFDLVITLDCGSLSRTGLEEEIREILVNRMAQAKETPYFIEFDHHEPQDAFADLEIRLPDKASTTEIIYHFLRANNINITKALATCILIGLLTDTGHFLHANSSQETIAVSSEMLLLGASLPKIISHTVSNRSFSALKAWGRALENTYFNQESGLMISALTKNDLEELLPPISLRPDPDLFGDIVSFLSNIKGVQVAVLLREEQGVVKGSLRTNKSINVAEIAKKWGGGGHQKAAGFSIKGKLVKKEKGWSVLRK